MKETTNIDKVLTVGLIISQIGRFFILIEREDASKWSPSYASKWETWGNNNLLECASLFYDYSIIDTAHNVHSHNHFKSKQMIGEK